MAYNQPKGAKMDNSPFRVKGNPHRAKNLKEAVDPFDPQSKLKREYNKKFQSPLAPAGKFITGVSTAVKVLQEIITGKNMGQ